MAGLWFCAHARFAPRRARPSAANVPARQEPTERGIVKRAEPSMDTVPTCFETKALRRGPSVPHANDERLRAAILPSSLPPEHRGRHETTQAAIPAVSRRDDKPQ